MGLFSSVLATAKDRESAVQRYSQFASGNEMLLKQVSNEFQFVCHHYTPTCKCDYLFYDVFLPRVSAAD